MPISQFTVGVSRTINLGNFESLRVEASVVMDVLENDSSPAGRKELSEIAQAELRRLMEETYRAWDPKKKKEVA